MNTQSILRSWVVVAAVGLVAAPMALAQGVGNVSTLPFQFQTGTPASGWLVAEPTGAPIPVVLDPTGPVWGKEFTGPNGTPFVYPATAPPLQVQELLVVSGNRPWTDWHEEVLDPGWSWANPTILVNSTAPTGLSVSLVGGSLSYYFDPVAPGSIVDIRKDLVYTGTPGTTFVGTLHIHEYPTPEPATLGLLALGSLMGLRRRGPRAC